MLFEKRYKKRANQAFDKMIVDPSFMKNNSLKSTAQPISSKKRFLAPALSACASLVLAGGLILTLILVNNKDNKNKMVLRPIVENAMRLDNENEIVREFESNASFVFGGTLTKKNADGKAIDINNSLVELDYSQFKKGTVGNYTINCHLKSDKNAYVSYNVLVNDEIIDHIKINNYRDTYYVGENVMNDDVEVIKVMKSGKEIHALPTEIVIDDSFFDSTQPGICQLTVHLSTNKAIKANYEVDVKPLEEIALEGNYAYTLDYIKVGTPVIRAFNINGKIKPEYSSIHITGHYKKTVKDGQVIIESDDIVNNGSSQVLRYVPQTREMIVYSSHTDRERKCFLMSERDVTFTVRNVHDRWTNYKFVAKNGYISNKQIDYFKFHYGGVYFDNAMNTPVTSLTHLDKDTYIYVGHVQDEVQNTGYYGSWYDPSSNNEIAFSINKEAFGDYSFSNTSTYTVNEKDDEVIIRNKGYVYSYDKVVGKLFLLDEYSGLRTTEYTKFDENTQAIFSLNDLNTNETHHIVYELGENLNKSFIQNAVITSVNVSSYYVNNIEFPYENEPVIENVSGRGTIVKQYLDDYAYKYGDYDSYWQFTDNFGASKQDNNDHHHYLIRVENGVTTRVGWVGFSEVVDKSYQVPATDEEGKQILDNNGNPVYRDINESYFKAYAHFDDYVVKEIKFSTISKSVNFGEGWLYPNYEVWKDMPFVGTYKSQDNKQTIDIHSSAIIGQHYLDKDGYDQVRYIYGAIASLEDNNIVINCADKMENGNRIDYQVTIEKLDGVYQFTLNDIRYYKQAQ